MSLENRPKRVGHISPIRLLQPSYLRLDPKPFIPPKPLSKSPISLSTPNLVSWMLPYHSLDRAVILHQAAARSRGRHDLLSLQFRGKKSSYLSQSLPSLPREQRKREERRGVDRGLLGVSQTSLKYFNSEVIPDMRASPVSISDVCAYVAYLERKHFK